MARFRIFVISTQYVWNPDLIQVKLRPGMRHRVTRNLQRQGEKAALSEGYRYGAYVPTSREGRKGRE